MTLIFAIRSSLMRNGTNKCEIPYKIGKNTDFSAKIHNFFGKMLNFVPQNLKFFREFGTFAPKFEIFPPKILMVRCFLYKFPKISPILN